jgi:hypothetical protein
MTPTTALTSLASTEHGHRPASQSTVKRALTLKWARPVVENDAYAAFAHRILTAYARRVATGDVDALPLLTGPSADIDTAIQAAVTGLRQRGYSWAEIGSRLGITRQAAQQRWGAAPS